MSLRLLAIDLGKRSFHIHGIDNDGVNEPLQTDRDDRRIGSRDGRDGGVRQRALLGPPLSRRWQSRFADRSALCEAVRHGGRRRNLRSACAPDDALCAGQID